MKVNMKERNVSYRRGKILKNYCSFPEKFS